MDLRDRVLYHQVHPLKLTTDWLTAAAAAALLWKHHLAWALPVGFGPSMLMTLALLGFADLTACRESWLGRYVGGFMTRSMELCRFLGLGVFWAGAWRHSVPLVITGVVGIIACWAVSFGVGGWERCVVRHENERSRGPIPVLGIAMRATNRRRS
jgi:hypothetical protein